MASLGGFSVSIQMNSLQLYMKIKIQYRTSKSGSNLQDLLGSELLSKNTWININVINLLKFTYNIYFYVDSKSNTLTLNKITNSILDRTIFKFIFLNFYNS